MGGNRVCSPCDTRNSISASPMVRVALIVPAFDIENREFTNKIQSKMMISQQSHNAKHTHNLFIQTESTTVHGIFCFHCATVSVDEIFCFVANGLRNNGLRACCCDTFSILHLHRLKGHFWRWSQKCAPLTNSAERYAIFVC